MSKNFDARSEALIEKGLGLLSKKTQLNTFWQNVAYNFYPQRAFFTRVDPYPYGRDFASNLTTSFPILVASEYANAISSYLRPSGQQWFEIDVAYRNKDTDLDNESKKWLEWATQVQYNFIQDRESGFSMAVDQGDADFAVFGQSAISIEIDWKRKTLLHRCWNLRDLAWTQGANGIIDFVVREWRTTINNAYQFFGDKLCANTLRKKGKEGDGEIIIHHVVLRTEDFYELFSTAEITKRDIKQPFVSLYLEVGEKHTIEQVGVPTIIYFIPRDQTVSGSQYAYSRAVVAALPDARLLQSITLSLLEAGEKTVNPPIITFENSVRDDISLAANTLNYLAYNEGQSIDDVVKVMNLDKSGLQYGLAMQDAIKAGQKDAFMLNKLQLPVFDREMTATEVRRRYQDWIRNAAPFVDRLQVEYNQVLCKMQFDTLKYVGAFGPADYMPNALREDLLRGNVSFKFKNPLLEAKEEEKMQKFVEMTGLIANNAAIDPDLAFLPNLDLALRDVFDGANIPAKWLNDEETVEVMKQEKAQAMQSQQLINDLASGGVAAQEIGKGAQAIQQAGLT
jgi:hypothetical protein